MTLAEMTGNSFVTRQMQELIIRTTMLDAFFESEIAWSCGCDEHRDVFRALAQRDGAGAARAMSTHLSLVETRFRPRRRKPIAADLVTVLQDEIGRFARDTAAEASARARPASRRRRASAASASSEPPEARAAKA
jgi:hypothetical protein